MESTCWGPSPPKCHISGQKTAILVLVLSVAVLVLVIDFDDHPSQHDAPQNDALDPSVAGIHLTTSGFTIPTRVRARAVMFITGGIRSLVAARHCLSPPQPFFAPPNFLPRIATACRSLAPISVH